MAKIQNLAVGPISAGPPNAWTAIAAQVATGTITIREDPGVLGFPSSDYYVFRGQRGALPPTDGSRTGAERVQSGLTYTFSKSPQLMAASLFFPGEIAGFIIMVAGTTTFTQTDPGA